jgi:hypothetical protein
LLAGVLFNVLFPDWLQTALLTVLLLFVIDKTVRKALTQWRQEQKAIQQRRREAGSLAVRSCVLNWQHNVCQPFPLPAQRYLARNNKSRCRRTHANDRM